MKRLAEARREVIAAMPPFPRDHRTCGPRSGVVATRGCPHAVPSFANSGVDGFAVQVADTAKTPVELRVIGDIPAGTAPSMTIVTGTVVRIMTGAPIPDGADGVVMVEDTETVGDRVRILRAAHVGDHVRPAGGDFAAGATVFPAGERLAPLISGCLPRSASHPLLSPAVRWWPSSPPVTR